MPRTRNIRGPSVFHAYPLAWPTNRFACGQAQGLSHPLAQGSNAVPRSRPDRLALCHLSRSEIQPVEIQVLLQGLRQLSGTRTRHTSHVCTRMHTYMFNMSIHLPRLPLILVKLRLDRPNAHDLQARAQGTWGNGETCVQ